MSTDPVCGMPVDERTAARHAEFAGHGYHFCSPHCLAKFQADPAAAPVHPKAHGAAHVDAAAHAAMPGPSPAGKEMAKDPICGMVVDKATALKTERASRSYAPIPALPWFTWGMWLFLLVTPAFVLLGRNMEALIKKRSSLSVVVNSALLKRPRLGGRS